MIIGDKTMVVNAVLREESRSRVWMLDIAVWMWQPELDLDLPEDIVQRAILGSENL